MPNALILQATVLLQLVIRIQQMTFFPPTESTQPIRILVEVDQQNEQLRTDLANELKKLNIGQLVAEKTGREVDEIEVLNVKKSSDSSNLGKDDSLGEGYANDVDLQFDIVATFKPDHLPSSVTDNSLLVRGVLDSDVS